MPLQDRTAVSAPLTSLPLELLHRTASFLGRDSLRQLRPTSTTLSHVASRALFSSVYFHLTERSLTHFNKIRSSADLAKYVRTVCLITYKYHENQYDEDNSEISDDFRTAFKASWEFPNLSGISLIFSPDCGLDRGVYSLSDDPLESFAWRNSVLQTLLDAFEALPSKDRIHSLLIKNLQNMNDPTVTTSPTFKSLLSQLRTLSLHIVSEWDEADPEKSLSFFEVHDFTAELPGTWLGPCAANLEHLKLYFDHYVGYCPLLDLRNLHFPKLKTLSLGNFVFSHNWQLDWILSHAATLEELYMDNCPILFAIRTYGGLQAEGYIPPSLVPNGGITHRPRNKEEIWFYDRLWHHYFAAFEQHLHQLRHFRFGSGDWSDDRAFEEAEALPLRLTEDRYKVFDIGTHPCHHTPASVDWRPADKTWYVRPRCSEEDRDAYISLLSRIGQAAPLDFLIKLFPS